MRNDLDKTRRQNQNTHFVANNFFFRKSCRFREIVDNIAEPGRPGIKIRRMCIAYWILKATNTH
jgi:hypothetical protein